MNIPADWPVRPIAATDPATDPVTCGQCGRTWDDAVPTSMTPAPSARCPFEPFHAPTIEFEWLVDPEVDSSDHSDETPAYALWLVRAVDADTGEVLDTLGACDFGRDGGPDCAGDCGDDCGCRLYRAGCEATVWDVALSARSL